MIEPTIESINVLFQKHKINDQIVSFQRLSGTTSGLVLRLESKNEYKYILKFDNPSQIGLVEQLLHTYEHSVLLPKVLFFCRRQFVFCLYIS